MLVAISPNITIGFHGVFKEKKYNDDIREVFCGFIILTIYFINFI